VNVHQTILKKNVGPRREVGDSEFENSAPLSSRKQTIKRLTRQLGKRSVGSMCAETRTRSDISQVNKLPVIHCRTRHIVPSQSQIAREKPRAVNYEVYVRVCAHRLSQKSVLPQIANINHANCEKNGNLHISDTIIS